MNKTIDIGISKKQRQQISDGLGLLLAAAFGDSTLIKLASIQEAASIPVKMEIVQQLVAGHEAFARTTRSAFEIADAANDQPSAELLCHRRQVHKKTAWMLRSLLET